MLDTLLEKGLRKQGFAVVEVISHCHTQYGKLNKLGGAVEMLQWQKEHAVMVDKAAEMRPDQLMDKFPIGVLVDRDLPVYTDEYDKIRSTARTQGRKQG
jgi:2-oxoglutarate/2-oxoacid ferredoxin oxidoreductase subunit beta